MSYEPICAHPQQEWQYRNCGCVECGLCGEVVRYCESRDCEVEESETAFTDEDVEGWDEL